MVVSILILMTIINGYLGLSFIVYNTCLPVYAIFCDSIIVICFLYRQGVIKKL